GLNLECSAFARSQLHLSLSVGHFGVPRSVMKVPVHRSPLRTPFRCFAQSVSACDHSPTMVGPNPVAVFTLASMSGPQVLQAKDILSECFRLTRLESNMVYSCASVTSVSP